MPQFTEYHEITSIFVENQDNARSERQMVAFRSRVLYLNRAREKVDAFDTGRSWTAQIVDEIILPGDTRKKIIEALDLTRSKNEQLPARSKNHTAPPT